MFHTILPKGCHGLSVANDVPWLCIPETTFVRSMVRIAAAGAATNGEEPEDCSDDRDGGREPGNPKRAGADGDSDVVGVEEGMESASQSGENDSGSEGSEQGKEARDLKYISFGVCRLIQEGNE